MDKPHTTTDILAEFLKSLRETGCSKGQEIFAKKFLAELQAMCFKRGASFSINRADLEEFPMKIMLALIQLKEDAWEILANKARFRRYLWSCVKNAVKGSLRDNKRHRLTQFVDDIVVDLQTGLSDKSAHIEETMAEIEQLVADRTNQKPWKAFELKYLSDPPLDTKQIAAKLGITENAVLQGVCRVRRQLAGKLPNPFKENTPTRPGRAANGRTSVD